MTRAQLEALPFVDRVGGPRAEHVKHGLNRVLELGDAATIQQEGAYERQGWDGMGWDRG